VKRGDHVRDARRGRADHESVAAQLRGQKPRDNVVQAAGRRHRRGRAALQAGDDVAKQRGQHPVGILHPSEPTRQGQQAGQLAPGIAKEDIQAGVPPRPSRIGRALAVARPGRIQHAGRDLPPPPAAAFGVDFQGPLDDHLQKPAGGGDDPRRRSRHRLKLCGRHRAEARQDGARFGRPGHGNGVVCGIIHVFSSLAHGQIPQLR